VLVNLGQNDPLPAIKNSSDSSHFQLMKGYLVELKEKLGRALQERKDYEKKYRSLKEKVGEKAEKAMALEEQNKLLRGKLEGFERLAERLQFELQRNIEQHDEEVAQMKQMTSSVLAKKADETKAANAFMRAQLDL
jgi:chromosome segregation ATPase